MKCTANKGGDDIAVLHVPRPSLPPPSSLSRHVDDWRDTQRGLHRGMRGTPGLKNDLSSIQSGIRDRTGGYFWQSGRKTTTAFRHN